MEFLEIDEEAMVPEVGDDYDEQLRIRPIVHWEKHIKTLDLDMQRDRLSTLYSWSHAIKHRTDLVEIAKNGFYYFGVGDKIKCHYCGTILRNWQTEIDTMNDHRIYGEGCAIITRNGFIRNIPLNAEDQPPAYLRYEKNIERLKSFDNFTEIDNYMASNLADAGFFYAGYWNKIICFECGTAGTDWLPEDDAWELHVKWNESCMYMSQHKDERDIAEIKLRLQNSMRNEILEQPNNLILNDTYCILCQEIPKDMVTMPCGHNVLCEECCNSVNICPVQNCHEIIVGKVKVRIC